jgi:hypothetical protein
VQYSLLIFKKFFVIIINVKGKGKSKSPLKNFKKIGLGELGVVLTQIRKYVRFE